MVDRAEFTVDATPYCRVMDILLEMDDHDIHLVDQDALDLRHPDFMFPFLDYIHTCVDGEKYASAALYCMFFLSNHP